MIVAVIGTPWETAGASVYDVLIYPDSQSGIILNGKRLWTQHRNQRTALYISMGDLVDNGEQDYQWRTWLNSIQTIEC